MQRKLIEYNRYRSQSFRRFCREGNYGIVAEARYRSRVASCDAIGPADDQGAHDTRDHGHRAGRREDYVGTEQLQLIG
jgi:hypothetical protein